MATTTGSTRNLVRTLWSPGRRLGATYLTEYEKAIDRSARMQKRVIGTLRKALS